MPSYIVKVAPDRDEYVWWSDVVEAPHAVGTRDELQALIREYGEPEEATDERFDRAELVGCSALWPRFDAPVYGWQDDDGPIAEQKGWLPRSAIGEYARTYIEESPEAAEVFIQPFEEDYADA